MVGVPLLALALVSTQLVLTFYLNNVALTAAVDAASAAALADGDEASGLHAGRETLALLAPHSEPQVAVSRMAGAPTTWKSQVTIDSPVLLLGLIQIHQSAEVIDENQ